MISNQILQSTVDGLKSITNIDLCVMDTDGKQLASTFAETENYEEPVRTFTGLALDSQALQDCHLFKVYDDQHLEYILLAHGVGEETKTLGKLAVFQLQGLLAAYQDRFDKDNFVKNLLLDNLLLVDIYSRAKKLHIEVIAKRVILVVEVPEEQSATALQHVRTIVGERNSDFVTAGDEKSIIIVKELSADDEYPYLEGYANDLRKQLTGHGMEQVRVAYGTIVNDVKEVSKSYKEAKLALEVGKIFFAEKDVVAYNTLGIGRLIYQLPVSLCRMFISEIFEGKSPDDFDEETLTTINRFFENSLNVSETSRQLYIHRNTLVYRLDKLQKTTGLDLRVFEDAITFKIALMVVKYMKYVETLEY